MIFLILQSQRQLQSNGELMLKNDVIGIFSNFRKKKIVFMPQLHCPLHRADLILEEFFLQAQKMSLHVFCQIASHALNLVFGYVSEQGDKEKCLKLPVSPLVCCIKY